MKKNLSFLLAVLFISTVSFGQILQNNGGANNDGFKGVKANVAAYTVTKSTIGVLQYDDGNIDKNLGKGKTFSINAFAYFPTSSFSSWVGDTIYKISVGVGDASTITSFQVCIWTDTSSHGANPIMTQTVSGLVDGWNDIFLTTPYILTSSDDIFIGYKMTTSGYSISCDGGATANGVGDMLQEPSNGKITHLGALGFGDLSIKASIGSLAPVEAELVSINNSLKVLASSSSTIGITGSIKNNGANSITSFDVAYKINGGAPVATHTVTPTSPIVTSATTTFAHNIPADFSTSGTYDVELYISNINGGGNDADLSNDTLTTSILSADEFYTKNVVYEEATGTWCGFCVRGLVGLNTMGHNITDGTWIGIGVHNGDPMVVSDYDQGIKKFIGGYPSGVMDRYEGAIDPGLASLQQGYNEHKNIKALGKIEITNKTYDASSRAWTVDVATTFGMNLTSANYNTALIIVENDVRGTTNGWEQHNYYSGGNYGPLTDWDGTDYTQLPKTIPAVDMSYNHVGRKLVDGFDGSTGSVPSSVTYNTPNNFSYSGTLAANNRAWNVSFVALLIDNASGHIVNATEASISGVGINTATENEYHIYPNPTTGIVTIEGTKDAQVIVYNVIGEVVFNTDNASDNTTVNLSSFAAGNYIVKIIDDNSVITKKIILTK